ncbi:hypothetical protein N7492_008029, partial [Penicillium capsulatum]
SSLSPSLSMSHPREEEDSEMAISYATRPSTGHSQTLPSFRELLPPHLHDEIDSSSYYSGRHSQDRPASGHEMADPRSLPGYAPHHPDVAYEHHREYTTRDQSRPPADHRSMSMRMGESARGPSPILPSIHDLHMSEHNRMPPRSDPYGHPDYRGPSSAPLPSRDPRDPYAHGAPMMHPQPAYGHPAMAYAEPEQLSPGVMPHSAQANFGIMGDPIDGKGKRRRGNLPKPITDILRTWFHEHLDHPYPSEEDKQMFMTRTGLSMSQISNWFINARRRQLPALRNQMRSGADADSSRHSPFSDVDDAMSSPHHH